jgi:hypothetical protein
MKYIGIITAATMIAASMFLGCTAMVSGGAGGETTNGIVASIYNQHGVLAVGAVVKLRSADYYSPVPSQTSAADTAPNSYTGLLGQQGRLSINSVAIGSYVIEVNDGNGFACVLRCSVTKADSQIDLGADTLKTTCMIDGAIPRDVHARYVQIAGLERLAAIDTQSNEFHISNLPAGTFTMRFVSADPAGSPLLANDMTLGPGETLTLPRYSAWQYSQKVQFNTTQAGANVQSDETKFPVLVRLSAQNFTFSQAKPDGSDIRFTKSDSTPLPYEIERWDATLRSAEIWVRVDTIYGNSATQSIFMFWGADAPGAFDASKSAAVFDTANGFAGVWHLGQAGGTTAFDATGNHYNGTPFNMTAASAVSGAIGIAQRFDGKSCFFEMPNSATGKLDFPQNGTYAVSAWAFTDTFDLYYHTIASKGDFQYDLEIIPSDEWQFAECNDGRGWDMTTARSPEKTWTYLTGIRNGSKEYLYINGILADSTISLSAATAARYTGFDVMIGRTRKLSGDTTGYFFKGMIDEVRIESVAPDADWILLCYMNQRADDRLVTFHK